MYKQPALPCLASCHRHCWLLPPASCARFIQTPASMLPNCRGYTTSFPRNFYLLNITLGSCCSLGSVQIRCSLLTRILWRKSLLKWISRLLVDARCHTSLTISTVMCLVSFLECVSTYPNGLRFKAPSDTPRLPGTSYVSSFYYLHSRLFAGKEESA